MNGRDLSRIYSTAHDRMRDLDGLLPQEAFDELLKFLFLRESIESAPQAPDSNGTLFARGYGIDPKSLRLKFHEALQTGAPWAMELWREGTFRLSDAALLELDRLFSSTRLTELPLDIRSTALRTFLTGELRKGLGVFLTPEDVVNMMVEVVSPTRGETVLDPACGSGTFLISAANSMLKQTANSRRKSVNVYGIDKNPRMLLLAELNLGHSKSVNFHRACDDSLRAFACGEKRIVGLKEGSVDVVLTNPPFGVSVASDTGLLAAFETGSAAFEGETSRVPSEMLFVELCLRMLRPGGRLGIVLPRSVLTNDRLSGARKAVDHLGFLTHLIDLPQETFSSTGTQTTTVAAFFERHPDRHKSSSVTVKTIRLTNIGFDSTGRHRDGSQLPELASRLRSETTPTAGPTVRTHDGVDAQSTLQLAAKLLSCDAMSSGSGATLGDFIESATTGRTPARQAYTEEGMFILKVGNLSGRGIDWEARERNFVSDPEAARRKRNPLLILRRGDIVLTSSAHASRYIAKKVDIIDRIPSDLEAKSVTYVGELIMVRAKDKVDPFVLLAVLRHPIVRDRLQRLVRGQTAHLNPSDLLQVACPFDLREPDEHLRKAASTLRREAELAHELNLVAVHGAQQIAEARME